MTVTAPAVDKPGAALDAQIAVLAALVAAAPVNSLTQASYAQALNQAQVAAVDHYMVTGWLNAATILITYSPPAWDVSGQTILARVAFLQALVNSPPVMPPGHHDGYGDSGWTTIGAAYAQALYAKQIELVEHLMALPGGTTAATILANLTGAQTNPAGIPFQYKFSSVGFTDLEEDD